MTPILLPGPGAVPSVSAEPTAASIDPPVGPADSCKGVIDLRISERDPHTASICQTLVGAAVWAKPGTKTALNCWAMQCAAVSIKSPEDECTTEPVQVCRSKPPRKMTPTSGRGSPKLRRECRKGCPQAVRACWRRPPNPRVGRRPSMPTPGTRRSPQYASGLMMTEAWRYKPLLARRFSSVYQFVTGRNGYSTGKQTLNSLPWQKCVPA
jgi:hypothetical protein